MTTTADPEGAAATPGDGPSIASSPTPRARKGAKPVGTIQRVSIAPDKTTKTPRAKGGRRTAAKGTRRPYVRRTTTAGLSGTTPGNQGSLISSLLSQNGFTDSAKLVVTEGRKTLSLPLGLFTGK